MRESGLHGSEGTRMGVSGRRRSTVKAGEVILRSTPFAHVIDAPYLSMYCDTCIVNHKECLLHPCRGCRVVWYCSEECQEQGQAWHRQECPFLKRRRHNLPTDFVRLLARVVLRLRNGGDKYVEKYSEREGRRFRDLMSHYADIKRNEEARKDAEHLREELGRLIGERQLPNVTDFLGIYGRIRVNRFSLFEKTLLNIGSAVYLAASIIDHECLPNCHIAFFGRTVEIRTLIDMPAFNFNKCRIAYVDPVSTTAARQQDLHRKWFFWCECSTCHNKERRRFENSVICENPVCRAPVSLPEIDTHNEAALRKTTTQQNAVMNGKREAEEEENCVPASQKKENNEASLDHRELEIRQNGKDEEVEGRCVVCGREVGETRTRRYWDAVAFTKEKLRNMTEEEPEMQFCLEMIECQQGLFSHLNAWRVRTLDFAFNAAMFSGCWSFALKYGEENEDGMRFYYGKENPVYYLFLFKFGKAKILFKEFRQGVKILDEAQAKLTIALGDSHPILEEIRLVNLSANEDVEICLERRIAAAKKREEEKEQSEQQRDNFTPLKTFPWISSEKDKTTKPMIRNSPIA